MALLSCDRAGSSTIDASEGSGNARTTASAPKITQSFIRALVISRLSFEERNGGAGQNSNHHSRPASHAPNPAWELRGSLTRLACPGQLPNPGVSVNRPIQTK